MTYEYQAPKTSATVAVVAGLFVSLSLQTVAASTTFALVGTVALAVGLYTGTQKVIRVATATLFVALLLAGLGGATPLQMLVATVGLLTAYDAGQYGVRLGHQVGASGETREAELYHLAASAGVSTVVAVVGGVVFVASPSSPPRAVVPTVLVAGVLLVLALSRSELTDNSPGPPDS